MTGALFPLSLYSLRESSTHFYIYLIFFIDFMALRGCWRYAGVIPRLLLLNVEGVHAACYSTRPLGSLPNTRSSFSGKCPSERLRPFIICLLLWSFFFLSGKECLTDNAWSV